MIRILLVSTLVAIACALPENFIVPRLDGRIVGGTTTTIDKYPYQLSLMYFGSHICGASVISNKYALTAAHCTDGSSAASLSIRAGSSYRTSGGTTVSVKKINQHPSYNAAKTDYDISILELSSNLSFGTNVQTIGLPASGSSVATGTNAVCTGWGTTSSGGSAANQLQTVTVQIVSQAECKSAYGSAAITDRMICAGVAAGGKDACQGDSGGPLVASNKQVGIVSWGRGCALKGYPGIYSSVSNLRSYITQITGL